MTTIIAYSNSEGTRRCDATCHDADPKTKCVCICGGRYHASGKENAQRLMTEDVRAGKLGEDLQRLVVTAEHQLEEQGTLV